MLEQEDRAFIARLIHSAANPREEIKICMQLFCCSRDDVIDCIPGGQETVDKFPKGRKDPYTNEQKHAFCIRYCNGEWDELMRELHIENKHSLQKRIHRWKGCFPGEVWPKPPLDQRMVKMCHAWFAGERISDLALRMGTSRGSARERLKSFVKHHPEVVEGLDDKRRKRKK